MKGPTGAVCVGHDTGSVSVDTLATGSDWTGPNRPVGWRPAQSSSCGSARSSARTAASQKPRKPSPSLAAMKSRKPVGSGDGAELPGGPDVPGPLAPLFEGHRPLVDGPGRSPEDEHAVAGQQGVGRRPHLGHGPTGAGRVVDRARRTRSPGPDPHRREPSSGPSPAGSRPCRPTPCRREGGCARPTPRRGAACASPGGAGCPSGTGQSPSTTRPSRSMRRTWAGRSSAQVRSHGIAQQRPVAQVDGDVAGQMVVVALPPQGPGQQHQFLPRRQVGDELVGRGGEVHGRLPSHGAGRRRASGWR